MDLNELEMKSVINSYPEIINALKENVDKFSKIFTKNLSGKQETAFLQNRRDKENLYREYRVNTNSPNNKHKNTENFGDRSIDENCESYRYKKHLLESSDGRYTCDYGQVDCPKQNFQYKTNEHDSDYSNLTYRKQTKEVLKIPLNSNFAHLKSACVEFTEFDACDQSSASESNHKKKMNDETFETFYVKNNQIYTQIDHEKQSNVEILKAEIVNQIDNLSQSFKYVMLYLNLNTLSNSLADASKEIKKMRSKSTLLRNKSCDELQRYKTWDCTYGPNVSSSSIFSDVVRTSPSPMRYNELSEESKFTSNFGTKNLCTNPQNQTALINPSEMDSPLVRRTYPPRSRSNLLSENWRVSRTQSFTIAKKGSKDCTNLSHTTSRQNEKALSEISKLRIKLFRSENELKAKEKDIKALSNEKIALIKKLMDASKLIDELSSKFHSVKNENSELSQKLLDKKTPRKDHKLVQACVHGYDNENRSEKEKSKFSPYPSQSRKETSNIFTAMNSENDEVLVGPDSPVKQTKMFRNDSMKFNIQNCQANDDRQESRCKSYEINNTNIFKTEVEASQIHTHSASLKSFEDIIKNQKKDIDYFRDLTKNLLYKNICRIKDAREAIGVILDFLQNMDRMNLKQLSDYISKFYNSAFGNNYKYFMNKLNYLKVEIEEIKNLNNQKIC
ncbi:unnamed protein product [Moneuplotes crassus]|uniref:Uncharacterized protein n=1 Tax=Euplotes crassus TaxID=5936 RepID=A0AAD1U2H8_EUPCR|nr:unnamed protein product [Moneuplotes crassus]